MVDLTEINNTYIKNKKSKINMNRRMAHYHYKELHKWGGYLPALNVLFYALLVVFLLRLIYNFRRTAVFNKPMLGLIGVFLFTSFLVKMKFSTYYR